MACSVMARDRGWRKERYPLHAIATSRIRGLFTACNMEAGPKTWRAYELVRHVNTPYSAIRCRTTLKPTGTGPKRASLEYIFAAALDAPLYAERSHVSLMI